MIILIDNQLKEVIERYPVKDLNVQFLNTIYQNIRVNGVTKQITLYEKLMNAYNGMIQSEKADNETAFFNFMRDYVSMYEQIKTYGCALLSVNEQRNQKQKQEKHNITVKDLKSDIRKLEGQIFEYEGIIKGLTQRLKDKKLKLKELEA